MKFIKAADVEETGVSHNPDIKKKVFLANGFIPNITTFGQATFTPGQSVDIHAHETMYEVFYILEGKASFVINGEEVIAEKDSCVVIEPKEPHSQSNPFNENVTWVYYGVAID
jgi:mannose-6-phosphate isomerase-like protein (cupin superfamily)